ncbi:hypothetical protein HELRODRAFT_66521 [Helobdella robusta]|uniref:Lipoxygenase domain-containing protein n=1 Tax=Helobdella robusta TaxID=6412 RepID=T1FYM2_HELRO|nr:hypothetical protein HELRODRAFT_66521 [Helobdella robusta]ESN98770.1 hypothetical protein HELRODRAFT_66521 [Helobdella robusta]
MGNCCEPPNKIDHFLYVKTGDIKGNLSNVKLRAKLQDINGKISNELKLDLHFGIDFERGRMNVFEAVSLNGFSDMVRVELWREDSEENQGDDLTDGVDWFCESLLVNNRQTEKCFYFPVLRWVLLNQHYKIEINDSLLPQTDPNAEQRKEELNHLQELYQYGQSAPDLPVQWDIINSQFQVLAKAGLSKLPATPWDSLEELLGVYVPELPEPVGVDRWSNDLCFGAQRLIGCNPTMIKLCTDLPENMSVTAEMLRPFLEGWTMKQIIEAKRLYVVDLKILKNIKTVPGHKVCAPIGLFFVTGDKQFVPIAIQLFQNIAPNNPVFLPNDPPFTWLLAKMWFNNADSAVHQALTHFCFTHLIMESVCVAMHRTISPSHPIYKLLAPHFLFLPSINARGLDQLISENGWIDRTTSLGREGMFELMKRGMDDWRMDVHGTFPKELESRGLLDLKVLNDYGYRDDGMLVYKALERYVNKIVFKCYESLEKLNNDIEIQNFARELSISKDDGGAGIKKNGTEICKTFTRAEDVSMLCINVIFTCTVQHAASNFPQYNEYAFPPNYPSILNGVPPTDKSPRTEEDILAVIPDKATTLEIMSITKLFSTRPPKSLTQWDFQNQFDYTAITAEAELRKELESISQTIKQRNETRDDIVKYFYLDPKNIPNFISV